MVINDAAHAPVFGALAVVWLLLLDRVAALEIWQRYAVAFVLAVSMGGLVELIQPVFGRDAEAADLMNDALGAIAGLAALAAFKLRKWRLLWVAVATLIPVAWPVAEASLAYASRVREFPSLLGGDTRADRYFIRTSGVDLRVASLPRPWARVGDPLSLRIRIVGGRWPEVALAEPQPDWLGHSRLMLDLTNSDARPLTLTLRVHDRSHDNRRDDRFNRTFTIPGSRRSVLSVPLTEIAGAPTARVLDLSRIAGVMLFCSGEPEPFGREYYLTRIWLE